jgi:hypothetical protein
MYGPAARVLRFCIRPVNGTPAIPLVNMSGGCLCDACFIDPRQLIGEGRGQNVRMQALKARAKSWRKFANGPVLSITGMG